MTLQFDETLGRVVRKEPWEELGTSTYRRIQESLKAGDFGGSRALLEYFHEEALVCHRLYDQWLGCTREFLRGRGMVEEEIVELATRLARIIALPGQPPWDRDEGWRKYVGRKDSLLAALGSPDGAVLSTESSLQALADTKESWRLSHDLDVDLLMGLFDEVMTRYGEAAIGDMWENHLVGDWFNTRYARFDLSKHDWRESFRLLVFLSFEAMHGHLCGPGREGDVEFREFPDRVELSFDPCGSGGRSYRGEPLDGTGSRMEAPYGFKAIQGAHDFAFNRPGICTYCAHCCVLTEKLPAQAFGYPVRVVDPPSYPHHANAKCRYTIYKNPRDVPAEVYARLGLAKPASDQPLGSAHGPFGK